MFLVFYPPETRIAYLILMMLITAAEGAKPGHLQPGSHSGLRVAMLVGLYRNDPCRE